MKSALIKIPLSWYEDILPSQMLAMAYNEGKNTILEEPDGMYRQISMGIAIIVKYNILRGVRFLCVENIPLEAMQVYR